MRWNLYLALQSIKKKKKKTNPRLDRSWAQGICNTIIVPK